MVRGVLEVSERGGESYGEKEKGVEEGQESGLGEAAESVRQGGIGAAEPDFCLPSWPERPEGKGVFFFRGAFPAGRLRVWRGRHLRA